MMMDIQSCQIEFGPESISLECTFSTQKVYEWSKCQYTLAPKIKRGKTNALFMFQSK